jgi:2-oxo-3-hexenedioate decarboxylase
VATGFEIDAIATATLAAYDNARQIAPFTSRFPTFSPEDASRVAAAVHKARMARGEQPVGRKVGFTNRTIWPEYGVYAPNWGYMYTRTVHDLADGAAGFPLKGLLEPKIEPEIMFGLSAAPAHGMDDADLLGCVDWVAQGYEIVHSIFPNWKFEAPDTRAANALHGALLIGRRHPVAPQRDVWLAGLTKFEVDLCRGNEVVERGSATNVLDGPLSVLRHVVDLLAEDPHHPPLAADEIISTGTLTRALPCAAGETWRTALRGVPLEPVEIRFA